MVIMLCIFLIVSVFEVVHLIRCKNKKEVVTYVVVTAMTVALAVYLMLVPEFKSFARLMLNLFSIEGK